MLSTGQALENILSEIKNLAQSKRVLVGISGGIAAYKSADLVRRLKERGHDVRVVMTESACQFITPLTLQAVSGHPVHLDLFDPDAEAAMGHIELAKWADMIVIAPATANTMAKIALGLCDNLLTTLAVASDARLVLAPAMNQQMWANSTTQANVAKLRQAGITLIGPAAGEQACGDIGEGRMQEPIEIAEQLSAIFSGVDANKVKTSTLAGKTIVITAGPTVEPIDPVRYISNHSSGKMGYSLANAAIERGARVVLISGPVSLSAPDGVELVKVKTANDMLMAVKQHIEDCEVFIGCAAVADYTPITVADQKIKKTADAMNIELTKNPDIIAWVAAQEQRPLVVGFAAESQNLEGFAKDKLQRKKLDMVCANDISKSGLGFNSDDNEIVIILADGNQVKLPANCKSEIASSILKQVEMALEVKSAN